MYKLLAYEARGRGLMSGLAATISEIGYHLLPSCDMADKIANTWVIGSVTDVLRAQSMFAINLWGVRPQASNPLHILQTYFGSEVRQ